MAVTITNKRTGQTVTSGSQSTAPVSAKSEVSGQRSEVSGQSGTVKITKRSAAPAEQVQKSEVSSRKTGTETKTGTKRRTLAEIIADSRAQTKALEAATGGYTSLVGSTAEGTQAAREAQDANVANISKNIRNLRTEYNETAPIEAEEQGLRAATAKDLTINSLKRGYVNSKLGKAAFNDMLFGTSNSDAIQQKMDTDESYRFVPMKWWQQGISGASELLGQQAKQAVDSVPLVLTAGGAAAVAGQLGPQALTPEEVITVPTAMVQAWKAGSAISNFQIESGLAYREMLENGVSEETAKKVALAVGGVNSGLEYLQLDELAKAGRVLQNTGSKGVVKQIAEILGRSALNTASETAQEVAQEASTIGGVQYATKRDTGNKAYTGQEVKDRLKDTAVQSALSFGILSAPGTVRNVTGAARNQRTEVSGQRSENAPAAQETQTGENNGVETRGDMQTAQDTAAEQTQTEARNQTAENSAVEQDQMPEVRGQRSENAVVSREEAVQQIADVESEADAVREEILKLYEQKDAIESRLILTRAQQKQVKYLKDRIEALYDQADALDAKENQMLADFERNYGDSLLQSDIDPYKRGSAQQRSEVRGQTTEAETNAAEPQVQSSERRVQSEEAETEQPVQAETQTAQEITPATVEAETAQEQQTETRTPEVRQPELVTETANDSNGMGAANAGFAYSRNALDAAENKYGTHEGGVKAVRPDNVPQKMDVVQRNEDGTVKTDDDGMAVTETMNVSESAKSFKGAEATPEDFVPLIENKLLESKGKNGFLFTSITNDETTKAATNNIINDGWDKALANWRSDVAAGKHSDVITATGAILYNNAVNSGDYQLAADIMMDYAENVRGTARALQATRILKNMPAEYRLYAVQSTVEKVNRATQEANEKTEAKRTKRGSKKRRVSEVEQAGRDAVGEAVKSTGTRYTNEPFVFEYDDAVGSAVANGIWQQQHPKAAKEKTFLQKIQSEIASVANQNIKKAKQEAGKAGAAAVDYYANQDFYENAYQKAKEEVMRRYEDAGEEIPEEVKTFLDSTVGGTVTVDGILKDINTKISDLVKGGDEAMKNAETTIHDMLTDEYGFSEDDANKATAAIMAKIRGKVNPLVKAIEKKKALKAAEAKYGGEPFVFEYSDYIGETIANGIWKRKHAKPAEAPTFLRQLLSEISALANKNMKTEKTETGKSGAAAVDYYANQAFYDEAYQNAKDAILRQYEDAGENIPSDVLEFLDSDAYGTVGVEGILKDIGTKLTDIANGGDKALATAKSDIQYMLMQDYGFSQESAAEVTNAISYKLEEAVKTRANEILAQRFGEKEAGGKDAKAYVDKLATLVNLGAFKSSKYHDAAMDYVFGDKSIKLSDEALQAYAEAETDAEIDAALDGIVKEIADQLPSTLLDKWTSLRYVNMLGNLKTQGRNVIGNTVMQGLSRTRYKISAAMQDLVYVISRKKFERTMTVLPGKDRIKAARADAKLMDDYLLGEQKYQDRDNRTFDPTGVMRKAQDEKTVWKFGDNKLTRKLGIEGKTWFGYRTMQAIDDATDTAMSKGDVIFSRSSYTNALAGIMKAKGITAEQWTDEAWQTEHADLADECRAFAIKQAQEDTFRDDNAFSTWASKIGRRKDTPKAVRIAAEGTMPFRKTPANVLVRAEEYSPLGLINTAVDAVKAAKGDATGADIVDQFAKTLTGSVIYGLGFMLAKKGILRAGGDDDDKQKQFDELTGQQEYSIVLPNGTSYTIDWASPAAIPLFMGAELFEAIKDDGLQWTDIEGTITRITEPMLQMSMLQGVNDTLDDLKYSKNNLLQLAASSAVDYLTQGLTSSLIGQGERTTEKNRMSTYTDPEGNLPTWLQKMLGKASAKTPVWEYQQYEYIDQWGQKESNGDLLTRIVTNFISPGYVSKVEMSSLEKELQRLADKTGETSVFPSYADKSFTVDGKTKHLSMEEYQKYATKKGQLSESIATKLTKSSVYKDLSDADKAAAISLCYQYANAKAKQSVSRYQPEGWLKTAIESGRDPAEYIADYVAYGSDYAGMDLSKLKKYGVTAETLYKADANKNGVSQEELSKYLWGRSDLDDAARQIIWDSVGGWKTSYADYTKKNKK